MRVRAAFYKSVIALLLLRLANNIILRRNNQTRVHAARKKPTRRDLVPINMRKEEFSAPSMCVAENILGAVGPCE